ncbi:MAG: S9 family peptidase, partial [Bacteroidota bacterium]|nr:S9 family peptidase [Bacteroidota bacterium]
TVLAGFHDAKQLSLDEAGTQLAFVAERDSSSKALQKFYRLYYYKDGMDSAMQLADRQTAGVPANWTISEFAKLVFSKSGKRLLAGTAPILPPKDTSLPEFDRVSLDVWNYKDDYIQPVQVKNLERELKRNYTVSIDLGSHQLVQLGSEHFRNVLETQEGDGSVFYTASDFGKRIPSQWQGFTLNDIYRIDPVTGKSELITRDFKGNILSPSYSGRYLLFYDERKPGYFVYNSLTRKTYPVAKDIKTSLSDEENDVPDDPNAYGMVKWTENDDAVLIYDRYDIWEIDPEGKKPSVCMTQGRKDRIQYRYVNTDPDEKYLKMDHPLLLRLFDEKDKSAGLALLHPELGNRLEQQFKEPVSLGFQIQKAKEADVLLYSKESFAHSTDMYVQSVNGQAKQLSATNPQQAGYNWGTAELFTWKAYTGKQTEGILYKPEDFDPHKKYPMIVYFYERNNQTLHNYQAPAPTPSRLNIPFFVSRGYVVFVPDIWYKTGHPGQGAYDYILSGTRAVVKQGYVDSTRIGLQGQSWGGFQIVYLITKTNLYKAAWAGAPVSNMTSAYGGIRWGSGLLRQFQYEKTQSRIGATLWEKPNLYIENSALFSLPKVTTPLVIMANDADDAVPWYQGIEMFAGMRRLGKKVWMLTYNGEVHNLMQRKNRKDISIREQQFFDYMLKGDKPATWITEGVPAVMKGRDLGLGYDK